MYCRRPKTQKCTEVSDPPSSGIDFLFEVSRTRATVRFSPHPFTFFTSPRMLDRVVSRAPSPSTSSPDDEECSFSPFRKREYLLAQMRQNDELIDSLLKQLRLSYALLTNIGTYVDYSRIPQLHNPYLATPLSIQAYRNATSSSDQHRQTVIAWLDRLQSSVRSPVRAPSATNPFQLDARAAKPVVSLMSRTKIRHLRGTRSHAVRRRARKILQSHQTPS